MNMEGYYFSSGIEDTLHNVELMPGDYLLLAIDSVTAEMDYGVTAYQWTGGNLINSTETLELRDPNGNVVDVVTYDDGGDWPTEPDGSGAALVLCDPSTDNSLGSNWIAGVEQSGIFVNGSQVLGSPGLPNDCTPPPPMGYTPYAIGEVNTENTDGVADSLGVLVELTGVVYGNNLRPGGQQFTIIDGSNEGIATFSNDEDFGLTIMEGDEVTVRGTIGQFNGLKQVNLDTLWINSMGNMLFDATVVNVLDEDTESQLVKLENLFYQSHIEAGGALNVTFVDGLGGSYLVRTDFDTGITEDFILSIASESVNVTGIGGQFDSNSPFDEGYQLLPRYEEDFEIIVNTTEPEWANTLRLAPNPVQTVLAVNLPQDVEYVMVHDVFGRLLQTYTHTSNQLRADFSDLSAGTYMLRFVANGESAVRKVVKQ